MSINEVRENEAYKLMLKEKEDANMKYIASRIDDLYYSTNYENVEIPVECHEKMMEFCQILDRETARKERTNRRKRILTIAGRCAVFLLCFGIAGVASISSSDAWKYKINELFPWFEEDHVVLLPYDTSETEDWEDYYMFTELPEGYELAYAEERGNTKTTVFKNGEKQLTLYQRPSTAKIFMDTETHSFETVKVNNKDAYLSYDTGTNDYYLIWLSDNHIIEIYSMYDDDMSKNKITDLAEKVKKK